MTDLEFAIELAKRAHKDQKDKGGNDYIEHPLEVARRVNTEQEKIVAVLHDVAEDTEVNLSALGALFGEEVRNALKCLCHKDGETYEHYIRRVKTNPLAVKVKLADISHNMDISRLSKIDEKAIKRLKKYVNAVEYLAA